jgi:parallel beta-helix repeat protein
MERTHTRNIITLLIVVLILTCSLSAFGTAGVAQTKTNPGVSDPSQETISQENETQQMNIQDAINQAQPGELIMLPVGTYTEIFTISKPLEIRGQGADATFLCPTSSQNGYAIRITAEGVILSGLDITNNGPGLYTTGVKISASHATIQDCTFHDTPVGIAIWSSDNTISHCDFNRCDDEGIVLLGTSQSECTRNTITFCTFQENCDGIELQYASQNTIDQCQFKQNIHAGIDAITSSNNENIISNCEFTGNQGFGLYLAGSSHNTITGCSFLDDSITLLHASENTVSNSEVSTIRLMDHSSLFLEQCKGIDKSAIISHQSSYTIDNTVSTLESPIKTNDESLRHPLLTILLERLTEIRSLYRQLRQQ